MHITFYILIGDLTTLYYTYVCVSPSLAQCTSLIIKMLDKNTYFVSCRGVERCKNGKYISTYR